VHGSIILSPVKKDIPSERFVTNPIKATLLLRLPLSTPTLNERQINTLAKGFSKVIKENDLPVNSIEWTRLRNVHRASSFKTMANAARVAQHWRNKTSYSGQASSITNSPADHQPASTGIGRCSPSGRHEAEADAQPHFMPSPSPQKRKRNDEQGSPSRRRYSQPVTLQSHAGAAEASDLLTPSSEEDTVRKDVVEDIGADPFC